MIKAIIWLSVLDETNNPIEIYTDTIKIVAIYPPTTGPQSKSPMIATLIGKNIVRAKATETNTSTAINFPKTKYTLGTGSVSNISKVPDFCSSLHCFIVKVATRNIRSVGIHENIGRTSEIFLAKNVSTQKKTNKVVARKTPKNIKAWGELKYPSNSFLVIAKSCRNRLEFIT